MDAIKIESAKKGQVIQRKQDSRKLYIYAGYCRLNKAYQIDDMDDISRCMYLRKGVLVWVD